MRQVRSLAAERSRLKGMPTVEDGGLAILVYLVSKDLISQH